MQDGDPNEAGTKGGHTSDEWHDTQNNKESEALK